MFYVPHLGGVSICVLCDFLQGVRIVFATEVFVELYSKYVLFLYKIKCYL